MERKLELLSYLAVKKFEQEQYVLFEQTEIEGYIAEFLGIGTRESRGVLRAIESQHGLLMERATKVWTFSHLTFQEYLVAKQFCYKSACKQLAKYVPQQNWSEVFKLSLEIVENPDELLITTKQFIDKILASDKKIQLFLYWIYQKSNLVRDGCDFSGKVVALRIFYFEYFYQGLWFTLAWSVPQLAQQIESSLDKDCLPFLTDIRLKNLLANASSECAWEDSDEASNILDDLDSMILDEDLAKYYFHLLKSLKDLRCEMKNVETRDKLRKWWHINGKKWGKKLRHKVIEYCCMGYEWEFDEEDKKLLEKYYRANELIVDCLYSSSIAITKPLCTESAEVP